MIARPLFCALAIAFFSLGLIEHGPQQVFHVQDQVENAFPKGVLFRLRLAADVPVKEVRLHYQVSPRGIPGVVSPPFEPGAIVEASYLLGWPQTYLHPGARITYWWEVTDEEGHALVTPTATYLYEDPRFPFRSLAEGKLTIHWYEGTEGDAKAFLRLAHEALEELQALLKVEVPFNVHVWVYRSPQDMAPALMPRSETFERQVITLGTKVADDTLLLAGLRDVDTLRHELAHIVTAVAGDTPFGSIPAWLDEGTAVYVQKSPGSFRFALERAVARDSLIPLPSLASPPGDPSLVELFYGQAWSVVSYLISTYGEEKFAQLFSVLKRGSLMNDALREVYGIGLRELEDEWRAWLGLPPVVWPTPQPQGLGEEAWRTPPRDDGVPWPLIGAGAAAVIGILMGAWSLQRLLRAG